jgi:hypothetical protein
MNGESKCTCQLCNGHIAFPTEAVGQTIECPHCKLKTLLFVPSVTKPPPLVRKAFLVTLGISCVACILSFIRPSTGHQPKPSPAFAYLANVNQHLKALADDFEYGRTLNSHSEITQLGFEITKEIRFITASLDNCPTNTLNAFQRKNLSECRGWIRQMLADNSIRPALGDPDSVNLIFDSIPANNPVEASALRIATLEAQNRILDRNLATLDGIDRKVRADLEHARDRLSNVVRSLRYRQAASP